MPTARAPGASPASALDFIVRFSSWRTSPSTSDYSPVASAEEPLLARTASGWISAQDAHAADFDEAGGNSRATYLGARRGQKDPSEAATAHARRRWLVACFVVILLAGAGWRISSAGSADLARSKDRLGAGVDSHFKAQDGVAEVAATEESVEDAVEEDSGQIEALPEVVTLPEPPQTVDAEPAPSALATASPATTLNVHPRPRPPSSVAASAHPNTKYLAYENHSGFHNQRKSLVNALVLAQLLDRTLLLPPARLGHAMPWERDPKHSVAFSERCKAGLEPELPVVANPKSHMIGLGEACGPPTSWTYVGWDYLIAPDLLDNRALVDRWNSSVEWLTDSFEAGGLGLNAHDIYSIPDTARRSYQILDSREATLDSSFESRLELADLRDPSGFGGKRLLLFGSLFGGNRLKLVDPANKALHDETSAKMILRNAGLDAISDQVRDALGSYVAVHARLGDGVFKSHAAQNMHRLFQKLCTEIFGLPKSVAEQLYNNVKPPRQRRPRSNTESRRRARALGHEASAVLVNYSDVDKPEEAVTGEEMPPSDTSSLPFPIEQEEVSPRLARRKPLKGGPGRPLASHLHCRGKLHDPVAAPHLAGLNTPLYIATDSRRPMYDPNLAPFFRRFPCVFLLGDFASTTDGGNGANAVNDEPIAELVRLVGGKSDETESTEWTSEWDGTDLGKFLLPFLEAEIAARAVRVLGTHQSTFSGYTTTILHDNYVANGLVAPWSDGGP
ncbi:hypothetical protein JCM10908_006747 [Rhodotorula pacifica]|uniref:uncharacterized protein n=1 Tax=Rhodotorula pacifica TaxID=1495444 RepID=UPI00317DEC8B